MEAPNQSEKPEDELKRLEVEKMREELRAMKVSRWIKPLGVLLPLLILIGTGLFNLDFIRISLDKDKAKYELEEAKFSKQQLDFQKENAAFFKQKQVVEQEKKEIDSISKRFKNVRDSLDTKGLELKQNEQRLYAQSERIKLGQDTLSRKIRAQQEELNEARLRHSNLAQDYDKILLELKTRQLEFTQLQNAATKIKAQLAIEYVEVYRLGLRVAYQDLFNEAGRAFLSTSRIVKLRKKLVDKSQLIYPIDSIPDHLDAYFAKVTAYDTIFERTGRYIYLQKELEHDVKNFAIEAVQTIGSEAERANRVLNQMARQIEAIVEQVEELELKPDFLENQLNFLEKER